MGPSHDEETARRFWRFSVALYGREGVSGRCLRLQERHGVDVSLMLFCLYAGMRFGRLEPAAVERAATLSQRWAGVAVRPLRGIRRAMKAELDELAALGLDAAGLRETVKRVELDAERAQHAALASLAERADGAPDAEAARRNFEACLAEAGVRSAADLMEDWDAIVREACAMRAETETNTETETETETERTKE